MRQKTSNTKEDLEYRNKKKVYKQNAYIHALIYAHWESRKELDINIARFLVEESLEQ